MEERDKKAQQLSAVGAVVTAVALLFALAAACSSQWATVSGALLGYFGPWRFCQRGVSDNCYSHASNLLRTTWATPVAGVGSVACVLLLLVATALGVMLVAMHRTSTRVVVKFRHAALGKMVCTAGAALCGMISVVCFILEVFVFKAGSYSGVGINLSYAFYLQLLAMFTSWGVGAASGLEWVWSRRLGGDPTMYQRDPGGHSAVTLSNPNFRDSKRANGTTVTKVAKVSKPPSRSASPHHKSRPGSPHRSTSPHHHTHSGSLQRNVNGVAMTRVSGQPYQVNGSNGSTNRGRSGSGGSLGLAFDPSRTPLRSSLRKPRPPGVADETPSSPDGAPPTDPSMGIQNPAFTQSSPTLKKKVRIHTQSTAV